MTGQQAKAVPLTRGFIAVVDESDFELVARFSWIAMPGKDTTYAGRRVTIGGRNTTLYMHRLLMGCSPGDGTEVDHRDGNGLNNRRENLRVCVHWQNLCNHRVPVLGASKFRGVWIDRRGTKAKPFQAMIKHRGGRRYWSC